MLMVCQKRSVSMPTQSLLDVNVTRRTAESEDSDMVTGQVYGMFYNNQYHYTGSTHADDLNDRKGLHVLKLSRDHLSSPLYRFVHDECGGTFDDWSIRCLATVTYDKTLFPDALLDMEDMCMRALRRCGHPLLNRNRAKGGDRRAYMRAWRARNPGYMARKGREHRERRRLAALALVAATDNDAQ
jgi:hypothetical protein